MKKFIYLFMMISILVFTAFSCNKNEVTSAEAIISPNGVYFADNIEEVKQHVKNLNLSGISEGDFTIDSLEFFESTEISMVMINYTTGGGISTNVVWKKNINNKKTVSDIDTDISCGGCNNCRVQAHIEPDGSMDVQCESSCCKMTIN